MDDGVLQLWIDRPPTTKFFRAHAPPTLYKSVSHAALDNVLTTVGTIAMLYSEIYTPQTSVVGSLNLNSDVRNTYTRRNFFDGLAACMHA